MATDEKDQLRIGPSVRCCVLFVSFALKMPLDFANFFNAFGKPSKRVF